MATNKDHKLENLEGSVRSHKCLKRARWDHGKLKYTFPIKMTFIFWHQPIVAKVF